MTFDFSLCFRDYSFTFFYLFPLFIVVFFHFCKRGQSIFPNTQRIGTKPIQKQEINIRSMSLYATLELNFDNRNIRDLPVERVSSLNAPVTSHAVANAIFSYVKPDPILRPKLVAFSSSALVDLLGVNLDLLLTEEGEHNIITEYMSGNKLLPGSVPVAHCYCGHQFGSFAGQLGDGAAISLGEVIGPKLNREELQLKGAGKTPFSRGSDGRKVLRSSTREFLCSEGMYYLNIPTTRAGTLVTSDSTVERDPYYNGNVILEKCSVVSRIAENFFRFGSFEIFKSKVSEGDRGGPSAGNEGLKEVLMDHVMWSYYNSTVGNIDELRPKEENYLNMFREITRRTAVLVAKWQACGFVHGVLNTDNMSIMGLTIDYGPFGFMEYFDQDYVPNGSDNSGRYSYRKQHVMCKWNLNKLAEAFHPLLPITSASTVLDHFDEIYDETYLNLMRSKLGLLVHKHDDSLLISNLLETMQTTRADFTEVFRALTLFHTQETQHTAGYSREGLLNNMVSLCADLSMYKSSLQRKQKIHRLSMNPSDTMAVWTLLEENPDSPAVSEMFGGAATEDIKQHFQAEKNKLDINIQIMKDLKTIESITDEQNMQSNRVVWGRWLEEYHARISLDVDADAQARVSAMKAANPTFVLRGWIVDDAIAAAEAGDYTKVRILLSMLETPFEDMYSSVQHKALTVEDISTLNVSCLAQSLFTSTVGTSEVLVRVLQVVENYCRGSQGTTSSICTCSS